MTEGGLLMDQSPEWGKIGSEAMRGGAKLTHEQLSRVLKGQEGRSSIVTDGNPRRQTCPTWVTEQILFLQDEHATMLSKLHEEIHTVQRNCAELTVKLARKQPDEVKEIGPLHGNNLLTAEAIRDTTRPSTNQAEIAELNSSLEATRRQLAELRLAKVADAQQSQTEANAKEIDYERRLTTKESAIQKLTTELNARSAEVAELTVQLHQMQLEKQKMSDEIAKLHSAPRSMSAVPPSSAGRRLSYQHHLDQHRSSGLSTEIQLVPHLVQTQRVLPHTSRYYNAVEKGTSRGGAQSGPRSSSSMMSLTAGRNRLNGSFQDEVQETGSVDKSRPNSKRYSFPGGHAMTSGAPKTSLAAMIAGSLDSTTSSSHRPPVTLAEGIGSAGEIAAPAVARSSKLTTSLTAPDGQADERNCGLPPISASPRPGPAITLSTLLANTKRAVGGSVPRPNQLVAVNHSLDRSNIPKHDEVAPEPKISSGNKHLPRTAGIGSQGGAAGRPASSSSTTAPQRLSGGRKALSMSTSYDPYYGLNGVAKSSGRTNLFSTFSKSTIPEGVACPPANDGGGATASRRRLSDVLHYSFFTGDAARTTFGRQPERGNPPRSTAEHGAASETQFPATAVSSTDRRHLILAGSSMSIEKPDTAASRQFYSRLGSLKSAASTAASSEVGNDVASKQEKTGNSRGKQPIGDRGAGSGKADDEEV